MYYIQQKRLSRKIIALQYHWGLTEAECVNNKQQAGVMNGSGRDFYSRFLYLILISKEKGSFHTGLLDKGAIFICIGFDEISQAGNPD